jgi:phenylalanyl-tRNA synthetase beta chain
VTVPGRRQDLSQEIDLVEEIARIYGYANIPRSIPAAQPQISSLDTREIIWRIKNILAGLGLQEVITPSLIDADLLKNCPSKIGSPAIEIANPLSREQGILRPSLIPSLVRCVAYNLNQKQDYINIFEIAEVFSSGRQGPTLGIALCGIKPLLLAEQGLIKEKTGLLHLKGISETLLERLGVKGFDLRPADNACLAEICIGQEKAGTMQALEAGALRYFDIKNKDVVVSEIFLEKILPHVCLGKHFVALPKYPGISRDISFVIAKEIPLARIYAAIQEKAGPLLRQAKVVDYYYGQQIPAGWRGLTISCFYRADQRTLTEEEINPLHQALCALLTERFGVKLR